MSRAPHPDAPKTAFVILEYCGGARTDALFERLAAWNPGAEILVLDNASPSNAARCTTHRNPINSYVGGGIRDSITLAESLGASYLFYCANDVEILDPLVVAEFEATMEASPDLVLLSCALTADSDQSAAFPWMAARPGRGLRQVRFADLVCCLMRLDFIASFGGFPASRGGWGYAAELAYNARLRGKTICVSDRCVVRNEGTQTHLTTTTGEIVDKEAEAVAVYAARYGSLGTVRAVLRKPFCDETLDISPALLRTAR